MRRDLDLIRQLLARFEGLALEEVVSARHTQVDPWTSDQVVYHCFLLEESGLIRGRISSTMSSKDMLVMSLTSAGHDALDAFRDESIWNKVKARTGEQGLNVSLDVAKSLAVMFISQALGMR